MTLVFPITFAVSIGDPSSLVITFLLGFAGGVALMLFDKIAPRVQS